MTRPLYWGGGGAIKTMVGVTSLSHSCKFLSCLCHIVLHVFPFVGMCQERRRINKSNATRTLKDLTRILEECDLYHCLYSYLIVPYIRVTFLSHSCQFLKHSCHINLHSTLFVGLSQERGRMQTDATRTL